MTAAVARERQLADLMRRAGEGAGGVLVNAVVYQAEYDLAKGDVRELEKVAEAKKCTIEPTTAQ
jgi:hypothetical protein